ncbi:MAG: trehalose-phosphatase [Desulfuromonadaceae bacterium]
MDNQRTVFHNFWTQLRNVQARYLLLDYDGTLAPFVPERDKAVPYPGLRSRLERILRAGHTRVIIISGRWSEELLPLLAINPPPEIWGCHGWEYRASDAPSVWEPVPPEINVLLEQARQYAHQAGLEKFLESKPVSLAVHWRGLPTATQKHIQNQARHLWQPLADDIVLELHPFDGGLELRCPARTKGSALTRILASAPAAAAVAFLGDDLTDEDGFKALESRGLGILVRAEYRPTAAAAWLRPPQELLEFLERWHEEASQGERTSKKHVRE